MNLEDTRGHRLHRDSQFVFVPAVKLVKRQLNGKEHTVLKENASLEDLRAEAARMKAVLGYDVQPDDRLGRYIATHTYYRGKYVLVLEPD